MSIEAGVNRLIALQPMLARAVEDARIPLHALADSVAPGTTTHAVVDVDRVLGQIGPARDALGGVRLIAQAADDAAWSTTATRLEWEIGGIDAFLKRVEQAAMESRTGRRAEVGMDALRGELDGGSYISGLTDITVSTGLRRRQVYSQPAAREAIDGALVRLEQGVQHAIDAGTRRLVADGSARPLTERARAALEVADQLAQSWGR